MIYIERYALFIMETEEYNLTVSEWLGLLPLVTQKMSAEADNISRDYSIQNLTILLTKLIDHEDRLRMESIANSSNTLYPIPLTTECWNIVQELLSNRSSI